jgi:hypothetical protein
MSAQGHKQTFALQQPMSALPPIATAKADIDQFNSVSTIRSKKTFHWFMGPRPSVFCPQLETRKRL